MIIHKLEQKIYFGEERSFSVSNWTLALIRKRAINLFWAVRQMSISLSLSLAAERGG